MNGERRDDPTKTTQRMDEVTAYVDGVLTAHGLYPERDASLRDTPRRVARMWEELLAGYGQDPANVLAVTFDDPGYDQMVVCCGIEFWSTCEQHMLPFYGTATVGYVPGAGGKVVGLSKLARLVDIYARRLQIQERMTHQIADALQEHLDPKGVGVFVQAQHLCMACRGVRKPGSRFRHRATNCTGREQNPGFRSTRTVNIPN